MNALDFLKCVHRKVKQLFERADRADRFAEKKKLFGEIKRELDACARIEQGILYPVIETHQEVEKQVLESYKKHLHIKVLLRGIEGLVSENKPCDRELTILKEIVSDGNEQEETKIFPYVRELLDDQTLEELGRQFQVATGFKRNCRESSIP
jgi:hypothetical protein